MYAPAGNSQFDRQHDQEKYPDLSSSDDGPVRDHSARTGASLGSFFLSISASGIMMRLSTPMSYATSMYDSTVA
jgi:hypothetical protein